MAALYLPALDAPFFADDYIFLDQVRGRSLSQVLAAPDPIGNFFRPVSRQLYFWTVTRLAGESPRVFHAANLTMFLAVLVLLLAVASRVAGARAGVISAALLGLHYAADVPVRWAAGSQELLAVAGALGALLLYLKGWRWPAALSLLIGLLAKETVVVTPLVATFAEGVARAGAGRADPQSPASEAWHRRLVRAWPLWTAVAVWAVLWFSRIQRGSLSASGVSFEPAGIPAAFAHLFQVLVGLEWSRGAMSFAPPLVSLAASAIAVGLARSRMVDAPGASARPIRMGIAWALLAAVPVITVASIWSAYYYLFAMCGAMLALGAWLSRRPLAVVVAAVVALGAGSAIGRDLRDFALARDPWTAQSHINRFYIERATREAGRYLAALRRARPSLPPNSEIYFTGLKASVAFQTADGPLLRWAYRESTLRSYYLSQFSVERARHGPVVLFIASGDTLVEARDPLSAIAFGLILSDRLEAAREALELARERGAKEPELGYWQAWVAWALGDTARGARLLREAGVNPDRGPSLRTRTAYAIVSAGDTARALEIMTAEVRRFGGDARAHGLLADLLLVRDPDDPRAVFEALAARALDPRDPYAWRRFGSVQMYRKHPPEALASLERYFELAGTAAPEDRQAREWIAEIRRGLPGGDLAQQGLRE